MIHIENFCTDNNISRRWAERLISRGELKAVKVSGKTYVIPDKTHSNPPAPKDFIAEQKSKFDTLIQSAKSAITRCPAAAKKIRKELIAEIKAQADALLKSGITIPGYNEKSIYRKLRQDTLARKPRADKFVIKNDILSRKEVRDKIYATAVAVYLECATSNFSLLTDLILERAKREEELFEVAAIPRSTLYNFFRKDFTLSGKRTLHQYLNHYNIFKQTLPKVAGAFTDDIGFFDYIIGDDHKLDVSAVLAWDDARRKWVHKQVKIWLWIEAKTMFPLGWKIKVGDFTVNDLKESLTEVFLQWGLPHKSVVIDNGIGRGQDFSTFLLRAGLGAEQLQFSAPYSPTNKAPGERSFGFIKNEFDVFFNNFVGPDKEREARHRTEKLSPEDTLETLSSYARKLESYLTGFYITRLRSRRVEGKVRKISIKDFFEEHYATHAKIECTRHRLRYAFGKEKDVKYNGEVTLGPEKFQTAEPMPLGWYGRRFRILYNPADMSEVDMYALEDMQNPHTSALHRKGSLICTLYNVRTHPHKYVLTADLKKKILKGTKKLADELLALKQSAQADADRTMPYVSNDGSLADERRQIKKQVVAELAKTIDSIEIPGPARILQPDREEVYQPLQQTDEAGEYTLTDDYIGEDSGLTQEAGNE